MEQIKLGGKKYPIKFGMSVIGQVLRSRKGKMSELQAVLDDILAFYELIYYATIKGCRKAKKEFLLDFDEFTDLLDEDTNEFNRMSNLFAESMSDGEETETEKEKKTKAVKG